MENSSDKDISAEELKAFMDSLVCDQFQVDPKSNFCNECGYRRSDHKKKTSSNEAQNPSTEATERAGEAPDSVAGQPGDSICFYCTGTHSHHAGWCKIHPCRTSDNAEAAI